MAVTFISSVFFEGRLRRHSDLNLGEDPFTRAAFESSPLPRNWNLSAAKELANIYNRWRTQKTAGTTDGE